MEVSINNAIGVLTLDKIIDRNPVAVTLDTLVVDAIGLMSPVLEQNISRSTRGNVALSFDKKHRNKSSYVLVVEEERLIGIFTETDLVKLIAEEIDLSGKKMFEVMSVNIITLKQYQSRDVSIALKLMREYNIHHLPVVNSSGLLIGIITYKNIRSSITPGCLLKMRCVSDVMNPTVIQCQEDINLQEIAKNMLENYAKYVVIVDNKTGILPDRSITIPIGIINEADLVEFQVSQLDFQKTKAKDVMGEALFFVSPDDSLWQAHRLMFAKKVQQLIVTKKSGELAGILTESSILQVFNPLEISRLVTILRYQVEIRTKELQQSNRKLEEDNDRLKQEADRRKLDLKRFKKFQNNFNNIANNVDNIITENKGIIYKMKLQLAEGDKEIELALEELAFNAEILIDLVKQIHCIANNIES